MNASDSDNFVPRPGSRQWFNIPKWIHAGAWGGILALVLLLIAVSHYYDGRNVWSGWTEARELRRPNYAERVYPDDFLRTRANSWSNLAYVLVGFYALGLAVHDRRRNPASTSGYLVSTPAMSILFGVACCYLGFGSGLFHASLTRWGQQLDVAAMYAPLLALIAINLAGWMPRVKIRGGGGGFPTWPILAALVLIASFLLYYYKWSMSSVKVLSTLILSVTVLAVLEEFIRRRRKTFWWLILSFATLVGARVCWELDVAKKFSGPDACLQGHAVWHLLSALSLATMYFYYRAEGNLDKSETSIETKLRSPNPRNPKEVRNPKGENGMLPRTEKMWLSAVFSGTNLAMSGLTGPIPKGLSPPAQGCEERATLGNPERSFHNPNGVVAGVAGPSRNPVGVGFFARCFPKVARSSQPWALSRNPLGIQKTGSTENSEEPKMGCETRGQRAYSDFGFLSDLGFRISDFSLNRA